MLPSPSDQRILALLIAFLLSTLVMLGETSYPPCVPISDIPLLEDGGILCVKGIVVDLWEYESGAESFILADPDGEHTIKVVSSSTVSPQPSEFATIGDEMIVVGELSKDGEVPTIFADSGGVSVSRESEDALRVSVLLKLWHLLDGDCLRVGGVLRTDGLLGLPRLFDEDGSCSLSLSRGAFDLNPYMNRCVIVTGVLGTDPRILCLALTIRGVSIDA